MCPVFEFDTVVMLKSLSLLAVLALSAVSLPAPAHASCSMTLLYGYANTWLLAQFNPSLTCQPRSCSGPVGTSCGTPAQNLSCKQCSQPGVTGWWDWTQNDSCGFAPLSIHGSIHYRPALPQNFNYPYTCLCSESVYSCHFT